MSEGRLGTFALVSAGQESAGVVVNAALAELPVGHAEDVGERRAIARPVISSSPAGAVRHRRYVGGAPTTAATA